MTADAQRHINLVNQRANLQVAGFRRVYHNIQPIQITGIGDGGLLQFKFARDAAFARLNVDILL